MNQPENAIVLAVGPDGSTAGVQFAIAEARRSKRPVHLVHVLQIPGGESYVGVYDGALELAKTTLGEALTRAKELAAGEVPVTGEVMDSGWTVQDLLDRSKHAALVVLEHRRLNKLRRLVTGSFANKVAAKATVPVVSVPEAWDPSANRPHVVTAAVQDPQEAGQLLRAAFAAAKERDAELVVLHAWWLASGYDSVVVDQALRDEWSARSREELAPVLKKLKARFPGVDVTVVVRHAPPVEAVLDAAAESQLLVIGRRHHLLPLGTHLGPVARAALDRSPAPVLVTPEPRTAATSKPSRPMTSAAR